LFSVATPVPQVVAALTALRILQREPERVQRLRMNTRRFLLGLQTLGFRLPPTKTPIVPILCETSEQAIAMTARCREEGLFLVPIIYPAVPMNAPRLRASITAAHTDGNIDSALEILALAGREVGLIQ
jgi:glycine C-acetyltransferase